LPNQAVANGRKQPALGIREVQAVLTQVLFEDAVLFPQVRDHVKLSAIHPSREGHEQNPPSDVEHPPSLLAAVPTRKSRLNFRILRDQVWARIEFLVRTAEMRGQIIPQPAGVAAGIRPPVADENSRN
jgi:hypothetical protein